MEQLTGNVSFMNVLIVCLSILLKSDEERVRRQQLSLRHDGELLVRKHAHKPPVQWRKGGAVALTVEYREL